ncbi:hypothetical protein RB195_019090 [Necator americanus]|uniref:Uncharacterized protein n=1 Tax=Necator americanus TaxID=51031 RepID=A0ABR1CCJ8_NECAM
MLVFTARPTLKYELEFVNYLKELFDGIVSLLTKESEEVIADDARSCEETENGVDICLEPTSKSEAVSC